MMKTDFESARQKYKPERIKFLLIAEAPPKPESGRFFYCEDVPTHDSLFLETMKVVYPADCSNIKSVRQRKREFLKRFKNDGFYLIDASDKPIATRSAKKKQIRKSLPSLIEKVKSLVSEDTKVILIAATVYKVCCNRLKSEGFTVVNECAIPFPIGWQKEFREKLSALLMNQMNQAVLVIGAGIAGIQASIDLAQMGFQVYLVERTPSIGGRMAQLDKTFPTNDCALCILAPKMIECAGHENVHLLTYSEVVAVTPPLPPPGGAGKGGVFQVRVCKKPRYVDVERCTGCGECVEKCPRRVPDEFNVGLSQRRAIYLPFPQAVPRKMTIDADYCLYLADREKGRCRLCEQVCQAGAIDWEQQEEIVELDVGAIVVATGFDPYDVSALEEYGFGKIPNVITGLQYERLISASGPTGGELQRPSDDEHPHTVAFIQCVGSRDVNYNPYCSSVCCMFATKEAILANEHDPEIHSYIFYTDLRAGGKRFQEYLARAQEEYQVTYIRGRPGVIGENPETGNPIVRYEDTTARQVREMEVGLVVLCQALVPRRGQREVAELLGIELDEYEFVRIPERLGRPVDTSVPGIFACGYCQSPQDIPDSVVQASGVAARVAEMQ